MRKRILLLLLWGSISLFKFESASAAQKMTEEGFNEVIDRVAAAFQEGENKGDEIQVVRYWKGQGQVDKATREPPLEMKVPTVTITGNIPRASELSSDGFALLVCHEFGHHLAGGNRIGIRKLESWSAAEGEADYWATSVCFRRYLNNSMGNGNDDLTSEEYGWKAMQAIRSLAKTLSTMNNSKIDLESKAPTTKKLIRRFRLDEHRDQCRVDTFIAGALGDFRPSCWFVESGS